MMRRDTAFTVGGLLLGAALLAKAVRSRHAIDLAGRVALITGGSRGLGLLIARELGRQGCTVVLAARDEIELQRAQQDLHADEIEAFIVVADVTREDEAQRMVTETVTQHGRVDILINNAGVITVGPLSHMSLADFDEAMATHF
jgi:NAD(P)-dependent dehydrogenase (short-subunit alcohol dehydrogenase family)